VTNESNEVLQQFLWEAPAIVGTTYNNQLQEVIFNLVHRSTLKLIGESSVLAKSDASFTLNQGVFNQLELRSIVISL
jgi:hypothetical protein